MIDIEFFAVRVSLNDQCTFLHQKGKLFGFFHIHDFRMCEIPFFVRTIDQKVRSLVGKLYAGKYFKPNLPAEPQALFKS